MKLFQPKRPAVADDSRSSNDLSASLADQRAMDPRTCIGRLRISQSFLPARINEVHGSSTISPFIPHLPCGRLRTIPA